MDIRPCGSARWLTPACPAVVSHGPGDKASSSNGDGLAALSTFMLVARNEVMTSSGTASGDAHGATSKDRNCRSNAVWVCRNIEFCWVGPLERTRPLRRRDSCGDGLPAPCVGVVLAPWARSRRKPQMCGGQCVRSAGAWRDQRGDARPPVQGSTAPQAPRLSRRATLACIPRIRVGANAESTSGNVAFRAPPKSKPNRRKQQRPRRPRAASRPPRERPRCPSPAPRLWPSGAKLKPPATRRATCRVRRRAWPTNAWGCASEVGE